MMDYLLMCPRARLCKPFRCQKCQRLGEEQFKQDQKCAFHQVTFGSLLASELLYMTQCQLASAHLGNIKLVLLLSVC